MDSPTKHGVVLYRVMFAWVCVLNDFVDSFRQRGMDVNPWSHGVVLHKVMFVRLLQKHNRIGFRCEPSLFTL